MYSPLSCSVSLCLWMLFRPSGRGWGTGCHLHISFSCTPAKTPKGAEDVGWAEVGTETGPTSLPGC